MSKKGVFMSGTPYFMSRLCRQLFVEYCLKCGCGIKIQVPLVEETGHKSGFLKGKFF